MSKFNKILCPVDLSVNSLAAIPLATMIAREKSAKIVFLYVPPQWLPEEAALGSDYVQRITQEDKQKFESLCPSDPGVECEHVSRFGNPGPEIVRESQKCDMVVMSTHGYGAMMRLLVGSVAQHVMRQAKCPVVTVRSADTKRHDSTSQVQVKRFVTEVMHQVAPIQESDKVTDVIAELEKARETAAPVINITGECSGILTQTDIEKYCDLKKRYEAGDTSVVDEMFEVDKYGLFRAGNSDFHQVKRHMSSPVVTISDTETIQQAAEIFADDQSIHHLVVVDENQHPLGIVNATECQRTAAVDATVKPVSNKS